MSTWTTNTETKSPEELTQTQKDSWCGQMGIYKKTEAAQINGDGGELFKVNYLSIPDPSAGDSDSKLLSRVRKDIGGEQFQTTVQVASLSVERVWEDPSGSKSYLCRLYNSGSLTIAGAYSPFTGTHIATSTEDLQIGELVKIESQQLHEKQPLWSASYCKGAKKGVFGIVYDKQEDKYLIAAVGDAIVKFSSENGPCEAGDYLIPSATLEGYVMVSNSDFVPINQCGKAGESATENKTIAWVKE